MDPPRRDWDAIVVGLGGIGSGAAYWLSRALGEGVLGLERFELDHVNGASADHSRIIRLSYHRPDYVRLAKRAYETWAEVERDAGERIVTVTGGLDLWPADPAIPMADYTDSLTAEGVPFELLDGAEVRRRWPQWRVGDELSRDVAARGRPGRPVPRQCRAPAPCPGERRDAARPQPGDVDPRCGRWRPRGGDAGGDVPDRAGRARRRRLDQRAARLVRPAPAADRHQGAGDLLRLPGPGGLRARPVPGLDLDGRAVLLRLPDVRRGRTEGRPGLWRPAGRAGRPDVRARRGRLRARRGVHGEPPAGRARPADLHQDLPLHAHPGSRLRGRSPARGARA